MPPSSSGLGHHPFKVATRIRIPLGAPRMSEQFEVRPLVLYARHGRGLLSTETGEAGQRHDPSWQGSPRRCLIAAKLPLQPYRRGRANGHQGRQRAPDIGVAEMEPVAHGQQRFDRAMDSGLPAAIVQIA